jgi:hypothetical protein
MFWDGITLKSPPIIAIVYIYTVRSLQLLAPSMSLIDRNTITKGRDPNTIPESQILSLILWPWRSAWWFKLGRPGLTSHFTFSTSLSLFNTYTLSRLISSLERAFISSSKHIVAHEAFNFHVCPLDMVSLRTTRRDHCRWCSCNIHAMPRLPAKYHARTDNCHSPVSTGLNM